MSFSRTANVLLARSKPASLTRFAPTPTAPRRCPQCSRPFSSFTPHRASSKRQLQTASVHHAQTLHPEPPPRNFGVPDTSIAGLQPEVNDANPPRTASEQLDTATKKERSSISIPEGEAQKPQPVQTSKPLRPRRYNFGARKATIKLSQSAVSHLRELLNQPEPKLIRIGTKAKGCSGLAYHLEYVDKPSMLDEQVEQDGVKVLIDNKALLNIIGSEMDWLEDKLNQRFVFKNPNITEQCGCGESFSVA
ncbi:iron-sulfur cluster assembly accessory protein-like protein Isa1 [Periconia macrospinosa]|uniref:Iron-sulfur assembly protein 1 n=1 Tax=Periconia macrospinosa TaxID=97972 RepID=A0A2V1E8S9_9PLEO|nr:iron-sulfur cluster assembly accessory protein-like protein Isa1 [Periconia macrospinosa]